VKNNFVSLTSLFDLDDDQSFEDDFGDLDMRYMTNRQSQQQVPKTADQLLREAIETNGMLLREINQLKNEMKIIKDRMWILYKEFKKYGHSIELFE